jgi:hypothetical protein
VAAGWGSSVGEGAPGEAGASTEVGVWASPGSVPASAAGVAGAGSVAVEMRRLRERGRRGA